MFTCLFHNKLSSSQCTVAAYYSAFHGYSPYKNSSPSAEILAFTFDDFIGVHRLPLRQYELECLEKYKIYYQYHSTTATGVPVPTELQ